VKPEHRGLLVQSLARKTLEMLGVGAESPTPEQVLDHSISQACIELEAVECLLDPDLKLADKPLLMFVVQGVRLRLELAREHNETLAELAGREAAQ